jgi:hypothetical protein
VRGRVLLGVGLIDGLWFVVWCLYGVYAIVRDWQIKISDTSSNLFSELINDRCRIS